MSIDRMLKILVLVAAFTVTSGVQAQAAPSKAEQVLKYRKSVYQVMLWNFGPMAAMAQGKAPYDAAEFSQARGARRRGSAHAAWKPILPNRRAWPNSRLKPEMWDNRADFDAKLKTLVDRSANLAAVAQGRRLREIESGFFRDRERLQILPRQVPKD